MKQLFTFLFFLILPFVLLGQSPQVNISWFPVAGDEYVEQRASTIGIFPLSGGIEQEWDFSFLADSSDSRVTSYALSADSPMADQFPNAALSAFSLPNTFEYFEVSNNMVNYWGTVSDLYNIYLDDPATRFQFPLTYGTTFNDTLAGVLEFSGLSLNYSGTTTLEVDGYGTLKLPEGREFNNALRYRYEEENMATHPVFGVLFETTIVSYVWLSPDCPEPLMSINNVVQVNSEGTFASKSVLYSKGVFTSVNAPNRLDDAVDVFPNPVDQVINIRSERTFEVLELFDVNGRLVLTQIEVDTGNAVVDLSHLPVGSYVIRLSGPEGIAVKKLLKL